MRAPDGQSVDCMLHVNPRLPQHKGLAMLINPTDRHMHEATTLNTSKMGEGGGGGEGEGEGSLEEYNETQKAS